MATTVACHCGFALQSIICSHCSIVVSQVCSVLLLFFCHTGLWEADQVKEKGEATRNEALSSSINSNKTPPITIEADKGDNSANSPVSAGLDSMGCISSPSGMPCNTLFVLHAL
uniref:Uncharacterized protein n=1 Tax=Dunaliella tertiolecta TaxID=3047 RepID=A0A7S3VN88_DUNTE